MFLFYRSSLCVSTARVTVCVCHAGIKGYLFTYLYNPRRSDDFWLPTANIYTVSTKKL